MGQLLIRKILASDVTLGSELGLRIGLVEFSTFKSGHSQGRNVRKEMFPRGGGAM